MNWLRLRVAARDDAAVVVFIEDDERLQRHQWRFVPAATYAGPPHQLRLQRYSVFERQTRRHKYRERRAWSASRYERDRVSQRARLIEAEEVPRSMELVTLVIATFAQRLRVRMTNDVEWPTAGQLLSRVRR